jgi:uncharacterized protein (UPF0210 family)
MKIRAVTSFIDPAHDLSNSLNNLAICSDEIISSLRSLGYTVQSQRIATSPFPQWLAQTPRDGWLKAIQQLGLQTSGLGWQYTSIGPALPGKLDDYTLIPEILSLDPNIFAGGVISHGVHLYPKAVASAAEVIVANSKLGMDGFTNLRFAALANVKPYAPFLPAAYANSGENPAIALAIECADEAVLAFENTSSLDEARRNFLDRLENNARKMVAVCERICSDHEVTFKGFDFSPAPFPEDWCSLGKAMELMGVTNLGVSGSLAAAAILASTLESGKWKRTGFNGLMLAVMEDSILAQRASSGSLTIKDLLLYSAVCGTGLDTIPLPGNASAEQLGAVLMDLGALAIRLNKPLTGRLMPIPGKSVGDRTDFEFEFFANSRVMALDTQTIGAPMTDAPRIEISARNTNQN